MTGIVKFFNGGRGFGFITTEDGEDIFVHRSDIMASNLLSEGLPVKFEVATSEKGKRAINVEVG